MYLARLNIENFRGVRKAKLLLKRRTLFIGPNNVGKTTVLEAVALLVGRDRMVIEPSEWDFFNGGMFREDGEPHPTPPSDSSTNVASPAAQAEVGPPSGSQDAGLGEGGGLTPVRIRISGVLADLSKDEKRLFCHPSRAGTLAAWNPGKGTLSAGPAKEGEQSAVLVAYEAQFDVDEGEVVSRRFFPVAGEDPLDGDPTDPLRRRHVQMVGYYLLSSTRLWKDAVRFTSAIFSSLVRQRQVHTGEQVRRIARSLEQLQPKAQDATELKDLLDGLRETVAKFIPLSQDDPLGFEVTELSSPEVERALTLFLRGSRDDRRFPMSRHGSAAISIQILAMLVMLGRHRREQGLSFLLGLEEPELHLHPHAQRNLVSAVRADATQILVTTHSPAITECFKPDEICVLSTRGGTLTGRYLLSHEVTLPTKNLIKRWVFSRRRLFAEALMSPAVLLVEGETEADILPRLTTLIAGSSSLDELGCAVVQCDGSGMPKLLQMLERFPGVRIALVDGDAKGDEYAGQIRALPAGQRPHLLLRLPPGEAIERSLAHGLSDDEAGRVLDRLKLSCEEICVEAPVARGQAALAVFLVDSKPKKNPLLRDAIADALRLAEVVPPVVAEILTAVAGTISARGTTLIERRLGSQDDLT